MSAKIKAGIIGATGYAGAELARLLYSHPDAEIAAVSSRHNAGEDFGGVFGNFKEAGITCGSGDIGELAETCDVVFLAMPHGEAGRTVTPEILTKTRVIDLGADFRMRDGAIYEQWYKTPPPPQETLRQAVYGLTELNRDYIANARLIANPGCYATCAILAFFPLIAEGVIEPDTVIIDAKSGVSGAGRGLTLGTHFCETNENISAYKIAAHRHTPEIEQGIGVAAISFTPHLTPMNRGILSTGYATLAAGKGGGDVKAAYEKYYGGERFIRLLGENAAPEPRWVKGSNFCDIGFTIDGRTNRVIAISALDNLVKGAAGQAVQNMNVMFGLDEGVGLNYLGGFPL